MHARSMVMEPNSTKMEHLKHTHAHEIAFPGIQIVFNCCHLMFWSPQVHIPLLFLSKTVVCPNIPSKCQL